MVALLRRFSRALSDLSTIAFFLLVTLLLALVVGLSLFGLPYATQAADRKNYSPILSLANSQNYNAPATATSENDRPLPNHPLVEVRPSLAPVTDRDMDALLDDPNPSIPDQASQNIPESPALTPPPEVGKLSLGPGITYFQAKRNYANGQAVYNVLEIADVTDPRVSLKVSLPNGRVQSREQVTGHMARNGPEVVAAINGDFFDIGAAYSGVTINAQLQDGELARSNEGNRPAFGIAKDGTPLIGVPRTSGSLIIGQKAVPIYHINYTPGENTNGRRDWLVMWTPSFGPSTATPNDPAAVAVVVRNLRTPLPLKPNTTYTGTVEQIIEGGGNTPIPSDGVVLHGRGTMADFLRRSAGKGTVLSFKFEMDEPWASARQIIGGCNRLLVNWVITKAVDTDCARPERDPRMPRSGVAFAGKKLWLVTVDGRQPPYSSGANSDEFAQFMFDLGAQQALNLDGGGSTTFAIRRDGQPLILNRPSDGRERAIANALLVMVKNN